MDLASLIDECMEQSRLRRQLAETTHKAYRWHLRCFAAWSLQQGEGTPTSESISGWMDSLQRPKAQGGRGLAPRSVRAAWHAIRFWDKWLVAEKHLEASALPSYPLPTMGDAEQPMLSSREADMLGMAVETLPDPFRRALARAVYLVLTTAAIRNCELRNLLVSHYDRHGRRLLVVRGKRKKSRRVGLCDQCCAAVDFWLTVRPENTHHNYLFCWDRARRLGTHGLWSLMEEVSQAAGFEPGVKAHKPHAMRHGGATRAHRKGEPLDQVRARLGHSSIRTTQIYLHVDEESLDETRNVTALDLDPAGMDEEYRKYIEEMQVRQQAQSGKPPKPPDAAPAPIPKPRPPADPRMRPRHTAPRRRLPPLK